MFLATGCGLGLAPWAPGTVGTLAGVAIWWFAFADLALIGRLAAVMVATLLALGVIRRATSRRELGDAQAIVLDEIVGIWAALATAPKALLPVAVGFALFRLADIAKPWPVSWADAKVKGAPGIVMDDLIAGATVALALGAWQALSLPL